MEKKQVTVETVVDGNNIYHNVRGLPNLTDLNSQVKAIVNQSSYWERYGSGLLSIGSAVPLHLVGLLMCSTEQPIVFLAGLILLGCCHSVLANRAGHLAAHNALFETPLYNSITRYLTVEFNGFFSLKAAMNIHIGDHHPYTNIIGLGDSSSWKAPMLPRYLYMFIAPVMVPALAPLVSLKELKGDIWTSIKFLISITLGYAFNIYLIMAIAGYTTILNATLFLFAYRAVTSVSYIHINIFQHIGLPMYKLESRPSKIYQMSTGVLNLERNLILDWIMGHTLVYCHIEHHLFPRLSDAMCLKVRPVVKKFLLENGLPYHEKPYMERLGFFVDRYEELMVKAPPFTHYVGLQ